MSLKVKLQIIDGTLKSYNSDEVTFSQWSRKGKVKGSKDFYLTFTLVDLYTKEPIYHMTIPRKYAGFWLFLRTFLENVPSTGEILVAW
nr:hypothetical protein [Mycoplasmopsis bovis]